MLQLKEYQFQVEYKPRLHNPAKYLSRHARTATKVKEQEALETEKYVRQIVERSRPLPISLEEIERASREDDCIQLETAAVQSGDWRPVTASSVHRPKEARQRLSSLHHMRDKLAVTTEGCLCWRPRLVVPRSLTQRAVDLAHCSHQGMVKTKGRLRNKVWFPLLDVMVETTVRAAKHVKLWDLQIL